MGDMADFALDNGWDEWEAFDDYSSGKISMEDALDQGIINHYGGVDQFPRTYGRGKCFQEVIQKRVTCKFCQEHGLLWNEQPDSTWRLINPQGEIHSCAAHSENDIAKDFMK